MKISGYVNDKNGLGVEGATVEIKNDDFETLYQTCSNSDGSYEIITQDGKYPFLVSVKNYGEENLEYWCQNIDLSRDIRLDIFFDKLEIYGLHVFSVKGAYPSLMVYFRPMSLEKFKNGDADIAPDMRDICVEIDNSKVEIYSKNKVGEFIGDRVLTAYLLQVALPSGQSDWKSLSVEICDENYNYGKADIFNS